MGCNCECDCGSFYNSPFFQTRRANEIANNALIQSTKANEISRDALEDTRTNDKDAKRRQELIDAFEFSKEERNRIKDSITIDLAQTSLRNQIYFATKSDSNFMKSISIADSSLKISNRSLEKLQKNFETENKALFFLGGFKCDTLKAARESKIVVTFRNFGKSPAILVDAAIGITIDTARILANDKFLYNQKDIKFINLFMPATGTYNYRITLEPTTPEIIEQVNKKNKTIFIYGQAVYYDLIRREHSIYEFCLRLHTNGTFEVTPNHNMIRELKTMEGR